MSVTPERFAQGMTWSEYKAQMTRNLDRAEENERSVTLSDDDVAFFAALPAPIHALVITEDWCGDAIANVPVLARLAEESGKLDMRLFLRDQNLDLIDQYLKEGKYRSIPVFVFFDGEFNELGHFIERPAVMTGLMQQAMGELFATEPAMAGVAPGTSPAEMPEAARNRMGQFFGEHRAKTRDQSDAEVIKSVREIIGK